MNLSYLFEIQGGLDAHIEKTHPRVDGENRVAKKNLALQVELAECAQESRCFKFWSNDQEPRTHVLVRPTMNYEDREYKNPLLEEYVDCLHFILGIGIELGFQSLRPYTITKTDSVVECFLDLFAITSSIQEGGHTLYRALLARFFELGEWLGFTSEQIEQAYLVKNEINHQRQLLGY